MTAASRSVRFLSASLMTVFLMEGCGGRDVTRDEWMSMSQRDKTVYVSSLLGHERAAARKGGQPLNRPPASPETYVKRLDDRYAGGSQEKVQELFDQIRHGRN